MTGSAKYIVQCRDGQMWWPITKPTTRACAHRVCARLGPGYRVYNLVTRRPSQA